MSTAHHGGLEGWGVATRDGAHTYVAPQVKLAAVHQERPLQVLLHDPFLWPLPALPSNNLCHRSDRGGNLNALRRTGMIGYVIRERHGCKQHERPTLARTEPRLVMRAGLMIQMFFTHCRLDACIMLRISVLPLPSVDPASCSDW